MSAALIPFPRTPIRAIVIIPDDEPNRDYCRAVIGGYPLENGDTVNLRGPLRTVLRRMMDDPRGLPVNVHPECKRRAGL